MICSMIWDTAVGVMLCLPWKYPRNAHDTDVKRNVGAMHMNISFASAIPHHLARKPEAK
ncbi:hypothetical protein SDC9_70103 [bioreactor metagenome]|uniref:Uncharacterized protein n=1 Tax=bioreactor metagenome TaxID=1076179 RepID=A0A644Y5P8_9ZZZZ